MTPPHKLGGLFLAAVALVLLAAPLGSASAESLGGWTSTTHYPAALSGVSCATWSSSVFCVGGSGGGSSNDQVYQATLGATGIGAWSAGPTYPTPVDGASCVNATAGIYCVGGEDGGAVLDYVYFAPASSSGLGRWTSQAAYPDPVAATSCVTYGGFVYCVGGFNRNGDEVSSTYYAPMSSGLTAWTGTTQYPAAVDSASCNAYRGYIYCVAGEVETASTQNSPISDVYYAPLTSSGIGPWTAALSYPEALAAESCAEYSGYLYCVGGFDIGQDSSNGVYYGQVSSSGVSSWSSAAPFPVAIDGSSCLAYRGQVYCLTGTSDTQAGRSVLSSAYYAAVSATTTSTTPEFPVAAAVPATLAVGLGLVVGLSRLGRLKGRLAG